MTTPARRSFSPCPTSTPPARAAPCSRWRAGSTAGFSRRRSASSGGAAGSSAEVEAAGIPILVAPFTVAARPLAGFPGRVRAAARAFAGQGFALWHSLHYLDDYSEPLIARAAGARFVFTKKNMSWNRRSWLLRSLFARRIAAQNTGHAAALLRRLAARRQNRLPATRGRHRTFRARFARRDGFGRRGGGPAAGRQRGAPPAGQRPGPPDRSRRAAAGHRAAPRRPAARRGLPRAAPPAGSPSWASASGSSCTARSRTCPAFLHSARRLRAGDPAARPDGRLPGRPARSHGLGPPGLRRRNSRRRRSPGSARERYPLAGRRPGLRGRPGRAASRAPGVSRPPAKARRLPRGNGFCKNSPSSRRYRATSSSTVRCSGLEVMVKSVKPDLCGDFLLFSAISSRPAAAPAERGGRFSRTKTPPCGARTLPILGAARLSARSR